MKDERVFNHALQLHPELDIALVNMANTLKDMVSIFCFSCEPLYPNVFGFAGPSCRCSSLLPQGCNHKSRPSRCLLWIEHVDECSL